MDEDGTQKKPKQNGSNLDNKVVALALCAMGLLGLYAHIEYSGLVLFFGLMTLP